MSNNIEEEFSKSLHAHVEACQHLYPLMARSWSITVMENVHVERPAVSIEKFNAKLTHSYPFYKPFCRVIEISDVK